MKNILLLWLLWVPFFVGAQTRGQIKTDKTLSNELNKLRKDHASLLTELQKEITELQNKKEKEETECIDKIIKTVDKILIREGRFISHFDSPIARYYDTESILKEHLYIDKRFYAVSSTVYSPSGRSNLLSRAGLRDDFLLMIHTNYMCAKISEDRYPKHRSFMDSLLEGMPVYFDEYYRMFTGEEGGPFSIAYSNELFYKGFLLNFAVRLNNLSLSDSVSAQKIHLLKSYHRRLATQYALPLSKRDSILVADLEAKANTLEKELVRTVSGYGEALRQVTWQKVQQQLKKDEAAIEFVNFRYNDKIALAAKKSPNIILGKYHWECVVDYIRCALFGEESNSSYAALLLLPGVNGPHFIPLCESRQLETIFNQKTTRDLYYQNIYNAYGSDASSLYRLIWAPLESYLQGVKTVYFSPSGLLHRLNLSAIQPVRRETLGDRYHLVAMGSTRNLVVPPTASVAGNTAALFGGIQYEMDSTKIAVAPPDTTSSSLVTRGSGGFIYTDSTLRGGTWGYLPATEKEITVTDNILKNNGFQTSVYRDYAATEEALQQIGNGKSPSPRVLHIATHGFFFPDPKSDVNRGPSAVDRESVFKISDNPMIRSGLLLAGANYAWKTGRPLRPGMEDGILTAYEISQMNLRNTELVVLSACETGLGQIEGNEGVYGLQRAFKIAGAKYLLMSLWQVPDKATHELMELFYKNWLDGGKSIPEAFQLAQAEMRKKYTNPFYWAGFVLVE